MSTMATIGLYVLWYFISRPITMLITAAIRGKSIFSDDKITEGLIPALAVLWLIPVVGESVMSLVVPIALLVELGALFTEVEAGVASIAKDRQEAKALAQNEKRLLAIREAGALSVVDDRQGAVSLTDVSRGR